MENKGLKISYNAIIETFDVHTKEVLQTTKVHNLVVNSGLNRVSDLIGGLSAVSFGYVAIGTDNTAVLATDTDLGAEVDRQAVVPSDEGTGIILYDFTFTFGTGESYTITEAGIFDNLTPSGSVMLNRLVFSGHNVDIDNSLRVKITITVANS